MRAIMKLLALGINHKTAPIAVRERAAFSVAGAAVALGDLIQREAVNEAVILSTCNRTEIYSQGSDAETIEQWLAEHRQLGAVTPYLYTHQNEAAVKHIMRVACGLDSMVLGEPQIFGQLKDAVALAEQSGTVGAKLGKLFQSVFAVGKQIRTETAIGANPVSVAYAALTLAQQIFAEVRKCNVLLLGAGETIELVATHFHNKGINNLTIANRSFDNALQIAEKFQARAIPFSEVNAHLAQAEIVITATASPIPVIGKGAVESALKLRKHRRMLLIDLAVPRDIEPEIAELEDIYLYNIDDLQNIINENLKNRSEAAKQAEDLIEIKAAHFMREFYALEHMDLIRAYRENVETISEQELMLALKQLQQGKDPAQLLKNLQYNLVQKILHKPSVRLRKAAYEGELDLLLSARKLFDI